MQGFWAHDKPRPYPRHEFVVAQYVRRGADERYEQLQREVGQCNLSVGARDALLSDVDTQIADDINFAANSRCVGWSLAQDSASTPKLRAPLLVPSAGQSLTSTLCLPPVDDCNSPLDSGLLRQAILLDLKHRQTQSRSPRVLAKQGLMRARRWLLARLEQPK